MDLDVSIRKINVEKAIHTCFVITLTLLLPISFSTLARLTSARYFLYLGTFPSKSLLVSIIFDINPKLLYARVILVALDALIHAFTSGFSFRTYLESRGFHPSICRARFFFGTFQACLGLGVLGSFIIRDESEGFDTEKGMLNNVVFFVGLHEIMMFWSMVVVKPIVDASFYGGFEEERCWRAEKLALTASLGWLWWWKLRNEVESMVVVVEVKKNVVGVELGDVLGWLLYHMTLLVGFVRIVKVIMCVCKEYWFSGTINESNGVIELEENKV